MPSGVTLSRSEKNVEVSEAILKLLRVLKKLNNIRSLRYVDLGEACDHIAGSINDLQMTSFEVEPRDVEHALTRLHHGKKLVTSKMLLDPDVKEMRHCIFLR